MVGNNQEQNQPLLCSIQVIKLLNFFQALQFSNVQKMFGYKWSFFSTFTLFKIIKEHKNAKMQKFSPLFISEANLPKSPTTICKLSCLGPTWAHIVMCFGGAKAISNVEASGPKKAPFLEHFLPTFFFPSLLLLLNCFKGTYLLLHRNLV